MYLVIVPFLVKILETETETGILHSCWHRCLHRHLCTPLLATGLNIQTSYLVHICTYAPHVCTSNIL